MVPPSVRVVFFDVHDTLIHLRHTPPEIFASILQEEGIVIWARKVAEVYPPLDELEAERRLHRDKSNEERFWLEFNAQLLSKLGIDDPEGRLAHALTEGFRAAHWWQAFPDVVPTLEALQRRGYRLGVIANASSLVLGRLEETGLTGYFETIVYSEAVGVEKPHPKIFKIALERMGCAPEEAVHVGDRLHEDVRGAQTVGIMPVLLDRSGNFLNMQCDCLRIRSLSELIPLLEGR